MGLMRIVGLDHVQLIMPPGREQEARRFYAGLLGMTEVAKPEPLASRGGCWFECRGTVVHVGAEEEFAPARRAHPAFCVTDLEACRHVLQQAGAPVVDDASLAGVRRFYTADPFGNRIELIQDGDGFAQRSPLTSEGGRRKAEG
jgi:catechol 2,3-dioxygenase-like lactoylglutathione lyase family enzyme